MSSAISSMTTNSTPRAVVAGHGSFAAGLISALDQITGLGHHFVAVSNGNLGAGGIAEAVVQALDAHGASVVFTDLPAGSCTMSVRRLARERPNLVLVTGVTLPTLLAFALGADPVEAVARGRESLQLVEVPRGA
jgi:PTS system N-acetylgalactosamine-specific IIA component